MLGFCITAKSKTFVCREQGAEIFPCLSLLCCFICSWGEGTLYCQRPWSHVSNPDPDLKCLKCQIFHFHILGLGHLVFVDIHNNNNIRQYQISTTSVIKFSIYFLYSIICKDNIHHQNCLLSSYHSYCKLMVLSNFMSTRHQDIKGHLNRMIFA